MRIEFRPTLGISENQARFSFTEFPLDPLKNLENEQLDHSYSKFVAS